MTIVEIDHRIYSIRSRIANLTFFIETTNECTTSAKNSRDKLNTVYEKLRHEKYEMTDK